jgi:hypothetical protein
MPMEQIKVEGDRLLAEVKRLVAEGNVRRIIISKVTIRWLSFPLPSEWPAPSSLLGWRL